MSKQLTNVGVIEPSGNDLINKELEAKIECFTLKKPTYQKLYIQEDYVDTVAINGKEYKCSDIVKHEKALEIIKEKNVDILRFKVCDTAYQYNECRAHKIEGYKDLTDEEYELLKEVLL